MALKTLHFVPGLSRTPLLFIPRYLTNLFFQHILQKETISRNENLKISKVDPGRLVDSFSPRDGPVEHVPTRRFLSLPCPLLLQERSLIDVLLWGQLGLHLQATANGIEWVTDGGTSNDSCLR